MSLCRLFIWCPDLFVMGVCETVSVDLDSNFNGLGASFYDSAASELAGVSRGCSRIGGFHVTSLPPCWWTVNKRSLISSHCLSTSICSFHHCYLCICVSRDCMKTAHRMKTGDIGQSFGTEMICLLFLQ